MNGKGLMFFVAGAALLGVLFVAFKPGPPPEPASAPGVAAPVAPAPLPAPAGPKVFELVVEGGKLAAGPAVIKVTEGDEIVVRITTDKADDLHLHGYDVHAHLKPGAATELRLVANRTGRFEYELHKSHVDLGVLEVHPR